MKLECCLACNDNDIRHRKWINNPAACLSSAILSSQVPSIQSVGIVGGGTSQDAGIVDRIKRLIMTMLSIITMLSSLCTTLYVIYSTFIHICFGHLFNFFVLITGHLFQSCQECATHLLLLLSLPTRREADNHSTMRISMTISGWYPTITMMVEMNIQNPTTSLFADHTRMQWSSGHQKIPSRQHLENMSWQLN